ncbi:MAG: glutaminase [Sulfurospirillaceae bacterium]|nr:glutaminase [Sulfurospirillaceae bacterium]MDD2825956.1 glutaminase [Sulfurospirillaceae bacterium]
MLEYQAILEEIEKEIKPYLGEGRVASYIPELARVEPNIFAMSVMCIDGRSFHVGAYEKRFSIQSISKLFTLTMAMRLVDEALWKRIGKEPSGSAFNSLVQLEYENGIPRNPFINAGALVITDVILSQLQDAQQSVLEFIRTLANKDDINFDFSVAKSEAQTGFRNHAMANFLKSFNNLNHDPARVLNAYFHHCSIAMNTQELAKAGLFLAHKGIQPWIDMPILSARQTKRINALMLTCGTYDSVGDFAYRVGLPAKSGVGGGILATLPGKFSVCVWSPRLNDKGNSYAGTKALELFTTKTKLSIF